MLILARGKNESIVINDNIEITIIDIKLDQIKIGIKAPKNVSINRKEIYEKIKQQMQQAAESELPNLKSTIESQPLTHLDGKDEKSKQVEIATEETEAKSNKKQENTSNHTNNTSSLGNPESSAPSN